MFMKSEIYRPWW